MTDEMTDAEKRKARSDEIQNNLEELGPKPSKIHTTGTAVRFEDRSVSIFEHEDMESITLLFKRQDRITAAVCLSREAAYHAMRLIESSMITYQKLKEGDKLVQLGSFKKEVN